MFEVEIGGKKVKAEVSFLTAQLYEAEFRSDIIQDLYGLQSFADGEFEFKDGSIVGIDFTKVRWLEVTKALWAAVKTADPTLPGYSEWVKTTSGANLWEIRDELVNAVNDCFFRAGAPEEGEPEEEE